MKLSAKIKLQPTPEQYHTILNTLETANAACNDISKQAWETETFQQYPIHYLVYQDIRKRYGLSAQMAVRAIAKVADAYKLDHRTQRTFQSRGAFPYDNRILSFKTSEQTVSIWTLEGRQRMPYLCGERQHELLEGDRGEADLCYIGGTFYLFVSCEVETPEPKDIDGYLGVDLGIVNLAADSDGEQFSGKTVDDNRRKFEHRRKNLQKKQTKSAKRKLKKISGKQARFQSNTNHMISKRLVTKAQDTQRAIALEDLSGIREAPVRRRQRNKHANWSFYQLRQYIAYKSELAGIPVTYVNPKYTSQMCSVCGYVSKSNRVSQSIFTCVSCGHSANTDTNAAVNIAARAAINQPNEHLAQGSAA